MQFVRSGRANVVGFDVLSLSDNRPVTGGVDVTLCLVARSGADAGAWWNGATGDWSQTEAVAATATHESRGHWIAEIAAEAWTAGVSYRVYGVASDDDYVVHSTDVLCLTSSGQWPEAEGTGPVGVTELKAHLRLDADDEEEDVLLAAYLAAATQWAEARAGRLFLLKTCVDAFDAFPSIIEPWRAPLYDVTSIIYVDNQGTERTLDASHYRVDKSKAWGRITPAYGESWPSTHAVLGAVTVTYRAGYGEEGADVPSLYRNAIMMIAGSLYENREETSPLAIHDVPFGAKMLLDIDRLVRT